MASDETRSTVEKQPPILEEQQLPSTSYGDIPTIDIDTIGTSSECLLLKNMFDPDVEVGVAPYLQHYHSFFSLIFFSGLKIICCCDRRIQILILKSKKTFKKNVQNSEN